MRPRESLYIVELVHKIIAVLVILAAGLGPAAAASVDAGSAAALRARHDELQEKLARNIFGRPLHLASQEDSNQLRGDVYGVVDHPFAQVDRGFREAKLTSSKELDEIFVRTVNTQARVTHFKSVAAKAGLLTRSASAVVCP